MDFPKSTQELLDRYWAAETTPEEEAQLRDAFASDDQSMTAAYFRFLQSERAVTMPAGAQTRKHIRRISLRRTLSVAATIAVLVVSGFLLQRTLTPSTQLPAQHAITDTYEDPEEAYAEARNALLLISEKLNSTRTRAGEYLSKTQPYLEIIK